MLFLSVRGFLDYAGPTGHSRFAWLPCCLPPTRNEVGILIYGLFAAQSPRPPMPLSTLQETPRDVPSKTRGQDGFATSFPVGLLHPLQHAGLSLRSPVCPPRIESSLSTRFESVPKFRNYHVSPARELLRPQKGTRDASASRLHKTKSHDMQCEMFAGHYGVSFLVKTAEPRLPLWLLFLAAQFVDLLWAPFVLVGIEHYRIVPGITASLPLDLYYMPYSHSLAAAVAWSAVVFAGYRWMTSGSDSRRGRPALFLALAVFSHWVLDFVVHRPDLPLYDNARKVGLGLWNYPLTAFALEAALLVSGILLYLRSTTANTFRGRYGVLLFGLAILAVHYLVLWGPPPRSLAAGAARMGALYLILAAAAYWLEKKEPHSPGR